MCLAAFLQLEMQRQPPFAMQRPAFRSVRVRCAAPRGDADFDASEKNVVRAVGDLSHNDTVHNRHVYARRGGRSGMIDARKPKASR